MTATGDVPGYLAGLDDPRRDALAELCDAIADTDPRVVGTIKWNVPSYLIVEHFVTTGLVRGGGLRLVLHTGAKKRPDAEAIAIEDPAGLLDWKGPDRAVVTFTDLADVRARREALQAVLRQWIDATQ